MAAEGLVWPWWRVGVRCPYGRVETVAAGGSCGGSWSL